MRRFLVSVLAVFAAAALHAAEPAAELVPVPESIVARDVPPIPRANVQDLFPYENIRTANLRDWHPKERRMLIGTRFAESNQVHEVAAPLGARTQLTFHRDPASGGLYRPNNPDQVVYSLNEGGAENFQLFLLDRRTGKTRRFSDGKSRYVAPLWSHDGKLLAYTSNARNGRDMDLYVIDPTAGGERRVAEAQGTWSPADWSPDSRQVLMNEYISINESYLHAVDVASGQARAITPRRQGQPTVSYQDGRFSRDGRSVYALSDRDSEFQRLARIDLASGQEVALSGDIPWDVESFDLSDDGKWIAFSVNEDGVSKLRFLDTATGKTSPGPDLPPGVLGSPTFRPGSHEVGFSLDWARSPSDVYSYDADTRRLERWTASEVGGLNPESFTVPELVRFPSFDGKTISAFVYKPAKDRFPGKRPVFLSIHGGPEGQSRPSFKSSNNFLMDELGVVMIFPNVRGSTGYGKTFQNLDNGRLREDSVKDIGALLDWLAKQPDLDASRVMVTGGSYGGYMVLASMVHYSDRLCCGWDSVGISDFVTFLENTQEYRRDLRRVEYGDERDPEMRRFLEGIAPNRQAKKITRPLLVSQGANDPRVPLSESDQIVASIKSNGVPIWYLVGKDEGHGFQKKSNVDYQRAVLFEFVRRFLLGEGQAGAAK